MSNTKPVGRALLFEHLPFVRFRQSAQGVLFVVFANGDAFFYPLNEQTKGDTVSGNKMPLTKDQHSKKKSGAANLEQYNPNKNTPSTSELASNSKPFAFDITLSLSPDLYRVFSFNFGIEEATDNARAPRKVLLSPDKQLLMIIGVLYRGKSSLVVYQMKKSGRSYLFIYILIVESYKILEEGPNFFHVVYHDLSFTFLDACFSPDSNCLVAILAKFPSLTRFILVDSHLIFVSTLPAQEPSSLPPPPPHSTINGQAKSSPNGNHADPSSSSSSSTKPPASSRPPTLNPSPPGPTPHNPNYIPPLPPWAKRFIATEPRKIGPILVLGPAVGPYGQTVKMTHISNNSVHPYPHPPPSHSPYDPTASGAPPYPPAFQYVTWNDDGYGEYCLWTVTKGTGGAGKGSSAGFIYHPRQLVTPNATSSDDEPPPSMRCQILSMAFAPAHPHRLLACLRRHGHPRSGANGYGVHMIDTAVSGVVPPAPGTGTPGGTAGPAGTSGGAGTAGGSGTKGREVWFQACGEGAEMSDLVCCKWSDTMLLGTVPSAALVVKGKGLYELVDHHCASVFQQLHEEFVNTISNFVQVGRYHRYWLNWTGKLRVIIVTPQTESPHPEWIDLFNHTHDPKHYLLEMRILHSRVGYFVNDLRLDPQANLSEPTKKKPTSTTTTNNNPYSALPPPSFGNTDVLMGLHLYRCFQCKQTLLRPLVCGRCMGAAYCSKKCQLLHMEAHKIDCIVPHLPSPYLPFHSHALPPNQRPSAPNPSFPLGFVPSSTSTYSNYTPLYVPPTSTPTPSSSSPSPSPGPTVPQSTSTSSSTTPPPSATTHPHNHAHTHTHTCSHPSHSHASPSPVSSSHK